MKKNSNSKDFYPYYKNELKGGLIFVEEMSAVSRCPFHVGRGYGLKVDVCTGYFECSECGKSGTVGEFHGLRLGMDDGEVKDPSVADAMKREVLLPCRNDQLGAVRLVWSDGSIIESKSSAVETPGQADGKNQAHDGKCRTLTLSEMLSLELPPREYLLYPILQTQSVSMLHAWRGIGKTHVALGMGVAMGVGGDFLGWNAPKQRKVLYIDGEMSARDLQQRLVSIMKNVPKSLPADDYFRILTPDFQRSGMPDLATREGQAEIDEIIRDAEVIIIDNLSCMCRNGRENESESWVHMQEWVLRHRAQGRSILLVHHSGKNGTQRGTSKREDVLDTVIGLRKPDDYVPSMGACFEVHYEKLRALYGKDADPFRAQLLADEDGGAFWVVNREMGSQDTSEQIVRMLQEGKNQSDIARELGVDKSTVSRHAKKAIAEGRIEKREPVKKPSVVTSIEDVRKTYQSQPVIRKN
ncbi:AAA family ATPase [Geobacter sp.]|uniref:AAA family ATPase n=1 Tax=Geobacter sp. TaxID=46610 RepID=UPI0027BAB6F9|nr:AAA family ATPase [Geobacter sp.]